MVIARQNEFYYMFFKVHVFFGKERIKVMKQLPLHIEHLRKETQNLKLDLMDYDGTRVNLL